MLVQSIHGDQIFETKHIFISVLKDQNGKAELGKFAIYASLPDSQTNSIRISPVYDNEQHAKLELGYFLTTLMSLTFFTSKVS